MLLVAPTEHDIQQFLKDSDESFRISSLPEKHGCDILSLTQSGIIGFQRKTLADLNASLLDGRLDYELRQIISSATLSYSFLIIESSLSRTVDNGFSECSLTIDAFRSILAKWASRGVGYLPSNNSGDTIRCITSVSRYIGSNRHTLDTRPKQLKNEWGRITSESYALFLLQSFPGIGPKQARSILSHFPTFPLAWTCTADDLAQIHGIGLKTATKLIDALSPSPSPPSA
jgi:Fanconi anemia group M protein